jgi:CheY-like chemotaxis protein
VKIDHAAAYVIADSTQLVRAVGNILQNAAEAGAKSIKITAHETEERGILEIMVDDDGSGMDRDVMEKAWSPFFTTRGVDHHGLGLPAAMHVISQAQGRIAIVSEKDKGSTVAIYLPKGIVNDEPLKAGNVKHLLLIDDNDDWANHFSELLKNTNVKLTQTTDLKKLPAADLVLVDENITAIPLADVLAAIAKEGLVSKTVVLTSAINPERVTQFMHDGMKDVSVKPYSAGEVSELLK